MGDSGLNPIQRKRVPSAAWADLNRTIQSNLADAMGGREEYGGNSTGTISNATPVATNSEADQIAEAVSKADRLDLKGAERAQWVNESLSGVWGMTPDEVRDVPEVAAALRKKPSKEDATAATVRAVEQVVRQAEQAVAADLSLDELLKRVNDQLANQGQVQNANTRAKRDQIRTAIAERDFPAILKAVDGDVGSAEAMNQALQRRQPHHTVPRRTSSWRRCRRLLKLSPVANRHRNLAPPARSQSGQSGTPYKAANSWLGCTAHQLRRRSAWLSVRCTAPNVVGSPLRSGSRRLAHPLEQRFG